VLVDGHLSKGFDALHDLRDTWLALLCLICKLSDVSVHHLRPTYCQNRSLPSKVIKMYLSCIHKNFRSKSVRTSIYKHNWNSFVTIFISPVDWSCLLCNQVGYNNFRLFALQIDQSMFTFVKFPRSSYF